MPTPPLSSTTQLRVWDLPTRIFHWTLVVLVSIGLITGFISPEWWLDIHIWAGYGIVLLIILRLVWGVFGPEFSRIDSFTFRPREVSAHLRSLLFRRPLHYLGHNPTGAIMIFALVLVLSSITVSGLIVLGGEENQGPLAGIVNYQSGAMAAEVHVTLSYILMVLIIGHISGVIVERRLTGENLVKSMINGNKIIPPGVTIPRMRAARPLAAATMVLVISLLAGCILWPLSQLPPSGMIQMVKSQEYQTECGDCHEVYHPSLLPKKSWAMLMADLEDHFGEDASLDEDVSAHITTHLLAYAGEAWDTEAANRLATVAPEAPYQISASLYWIRKHGDIVESTFKRDGVGGKSHCGSCHQDAAGGRFYDQMIEIPEDTIQL